MAEALAPRQLSGIHRDERISYWLSIKGSVTQRKNKHLQIKQEPNSQGFLRGREGLICYPTPEVSSAAAPQLSFLLCSHEENPLESILFLITSYPVPKHLFGAGKAICRVTSGHHLCVGFAGTCPQERCGVTGADWELWAGAWMASLSHQGICISKSKPSCLKIRSQGCKAWDGEWKPQGCFSCCLVCDPCWAPSGPSASHIFQPSLATSGDIFLKK